MAAALQLRQHCRQVPGSLGPLGHHRGGGVTAASLVLRALRPGDHHGQVGLAQPQRPSISRFSTWSRQEVCRTRPWSSGQWRGSKCRWSAPSLRAIPSACDSDCLKIHTTTVSVGRVEVHLITLAWIPVDELSEDQIFACIQQTWRSGEHRYPSCCLIGISIAIRFQQSGNAFSSPAASASKVSLGVRVMVDLAIAWVAVPSRSGLLGHRDQDGTLQARSRNCRINGNSCGSMPWPPSNSWRVTWAPPARRASSRAEQASAGTT